MPHKDPTIKAAYFKAYRERNKARLTALNAQYRALNADAIKEKKRREYLEYIEAYKQRSRARWAARKDEINAKRRSPEFKARKNEQRKAWWAARPLWEKRYYTGLAQAYGRDHAGLGDTENLKAWYQLAFSVPSVTCAYCQRVITTVLAVVDHKQPYRHGGLHESNNLALTCRDCNALKGSTPWEVWAAYLNAKKGMIWQ